MMELDARILDVLRSRAKWRRGKTYIAMDEVVDLIQGRFPDAPRPGPAEIKSAVKTLTRQRLIQWSVATDDGIVFIV